MSSNEVIFGWGAPVKEATQMVDVNGLKNIASRSSDGLLRGPALAAADEIETLRAELEQTKEIYLRAWNERDAQRRRAEAAERLAGARVKATSDELSRYIERCRELSDGGEYSWWSRLAEILSALTEPAGEVEPRQFLPTEDGEFNGNTTEVPIAAEDGREVDWVDVTGWGAFKGHAIPVDAARYIAEKINLYAEHRTTPPDASAIREALVEIANGCSGRVDRDHLACRIASAALAGAKP